jgi:hypothetical protein
MHTAPINYIISVVLFISVGTFHLSIKKKKKVHEYKSLSNSISLIMNTIYRSHPSTSCMKLAKIVWRVMLPPFPSRFKPLYLFLIRNQNVSKIKLWFVVPECQLYADVSFLDVTVTFQKSRMPSWRVVADLSNILNDSVIEKNHG